KIDLSEKDKKTNQAYSLALSRYKEFLEYTSKIKIHQKIIYGAPGTGKSYSLNKDIKENFKNISIENFLISEEEIDRSYWAVGSFWDKKNMLEDFIENSYWENGYDDKYLDKVKKIKINDLIVIKSSFARKENGKFLSVVRIKALGIVTKNYGDGKKIDVDWKITGKEIDYDNISLRITIQEIFGNDRKIFNSLEEQIKSKNEILKTIETISTSERVTFYDGYTYGQFVGAYKPVPVTGNSEEEKDISYEYVPGPMIKLLEKAYNHPNENFVLVIEEINRARADRVFGNIFQLLDRDESGKSQYPVSLSEEQQRYFKDKLKKDTIKEEGGLYLPSNLYIWATMNSADQGVYPMDSAFKRRWDFKYIGLDDNADKFGEQTYEYLIALYYTGEKKNKKEDEDPTYQEVKWNNFRKVINDTLLNERVPEDRLLAPFFIKPKDFSIKDENRENGFWIIDEIYESKILMYLFDDVLRHRGKDKIFRRDLRSFSELIREYRAGKSIFNEEITEKMLELEETLELSEKQD
ncbi:MAG: AAA family ATPase, partial [Cetobacterium sp.]